MYEVSRPTSAEESENELNQFVQDLEIAHRHALRAFNALYRPFGPKRSILYRMALGRAQSVLIGLYKQELQRRSHRGIDS